MSKKIIIDARMVDEELHGIGRYTYELINGISKRSDLDLKILVNDEEKTKRIFKNDKIDTIEVKSGFLSPMEIFEIPLKVNKFKDYVYFTPSFSASPFIKLEKFMTLHDLNHIKLPQYYSKFHLLYYRYIVKPFAKKCKKIFTVSNFSKKEIVEWLECNDDKVNVTYNGVDDKFRIIDDKERLKSIKEKYKLPEKFILYVGNQKPHKNLDVILKAMKYLEYTLVINGDKGERVEGIIKNLDIDEKVKFIGYIEDEDLPYIYNASEVFIFPSFYEGFGLPPLEAYMSGTRVLVSDIEVHNEILGNDVMKFSPTDYMELVKKIELLKLREIDCDYEKYKKKFNWEKMNLKTIDEVFK